MQEIIRFLVNNVEVVTKVKEGKACLIGVTPEESKAIIEVFSDKPTTTKRYYWM
ncbi:MAG: competence pheromone ComX [Thermoanaerobacterium sp.]|nr:competence pheromone ComX [Thermoanaerobacterium sp.]